MFQALAPFKYRIAAFVLLIILHGLVPAAEIVMPADVTKALDKSTADIATVQAKADDDIVKVRRALVASLVKAQEKATKAGNLELAMAIKAKADEQTKLMPETALLNAPPAPDAWLGKWRVSKSGYSAVWTFDDKGKVEAVPGAGKGSYTVRGGALVTSWGESMTIPTAGANSTTGTAAAGDSLSFTRIQ